MKRYEAYAAEIAGLIAESTLRPGDRLPSVRQACASRKISPSTVFQAYDLLESRGLVRARPRSGYYVTALGPAPLAELQATHPPADAQPVAINDLFFDMLSSVRSRGIVPLGSAFPGPTPFPPPALPRALGAAPPP